MFDNLFRAAAVLGTIDAKREADLGVRRSKKSSLQNRQAIKKNQWPTLPFLREMERRENANGQKFGQVRVSSRLLNFQQDVPDLQDQLI